MNCRSVGSTVGTYTVVDFLAVSVPVLRFRDVYPGSRILIFTHPGSRIPDLGSRIPDPKTATEERGEKKLDVIPFYVATISQHCKLF
jgi:hypothetical protein